MAHRLLSRAKPVSNVDHRRISRGPGGPDQGVAGARCVLRGDVLFSVVFQGLALAAAPVESGWHPHFPSSGGRLAGPFYMETGWHGVWSTWFNPGASRLGADWTALLRHKVTFPLVVFGATLPWSPLLLGLLRREFWNLGSSGRSAVVFLLCGSAGVLVPVWLSPGGHQRYVMPMYPLLAVLCGAVVHQGLSLAPLGFLSRLWRDFVRVLAMVVAGATIVFLGMTACTLFSVHEWVLRLAQPWWQIVLLVVLVVPAAGFLIRRASSSYPRDALWVTFIAGALVALLFNGPIINSLAQAAVDVRPDVASLYRRIPQGARLVSIGPADHQLPRACPRWTRLLYYYPEPIPVVRRPRSAEHVPEDLEYFVIDGHRGEPTVLPFEWEEIGRLNMDRNRRDDPENLVIVGRRLRTQTRPAEMK
jgi:hypothetical protein